MTTMVTHGYLIIHGVGPFIMEDGNDDYYGWAGTIRVGSSLGFLEKCDIMDGPMFQDLI